MNRYFDKNDVFSSNNRIFESFFTDAPVQKTKLEKWLEKLSRVLFSILVFLSSAAFVKLAKCIGVAGSLVGFVGIIGAMEQGTLGLGIGLCIGAVLLLIEYLCLRGNHRS